MTDKKQAWRTGGSFPSSVVAVCLLLILPGNHIVKSKPVLSDPDSRHITALTATNQREPRQGLFGGLTSGLFPGTGLAALALPLIGSGLSSGQSGSSGSSWGGNGGGSGGGSSDDLAIAAAFSLLGLALINNLPTQG